MLLGALKIMSTEDKTLPGLTTLVFLASLGCVGTSWSVESRKAEPHQSAGAYLLVCGEKNKNISKGANDEVLKDVLSSYKGDPR